MIKKAKLEDLSSIMQLIQLNSDTFSSFELLSARKYIKELINKQNKDNNFFVWINSAREVVGCGGYSKQDDTDSVYSLCWLAVHPDFKRQGIAKELCKYIENKLKTLGARLLISNAGSNETNRFFYKKMGFKVAGIIPEYYGQEKGLVWYYKLLPIHGSFGFLRSIYIFFKICPTMVGFRKGKKSRRSNWILVFEYSWLSFANSLFYQTRRYCIYHCIGIEYNDLYKEHHLDTQ